MNNPRPDELWLDPLLSRHLTRVSAPDDLWRRIQDSPSAVPASPRRAIPAPVYRWVLTTAVLVIAVAWGILLRSEQRLLTAREVALQALEREPEDLDFRSSTGSEIRTWVKARTGLEIPLPSHAAENVRLAGACAVPGGSPSIEVAYRIAGRKAALVVSKAAHHDAGDKHRFLHCESVGSARVSSWTMRGQLYTLAYQNHGELRDECLLCHNGSDPMVLRN